LIPHYRIPLFEHIAAGPEVELVVLADIERETQLNQYRGSGKFEVRHLPFNLIGPFVFRPGLRSLLQDVRPDAVLFHGNPREIFLLSHMKWCRRNGIPFGVWGMFFRVGKRRPVSEYLMSRMGKLAKVVLCYGERDGREMRQRGTDPNKIVPLYNSIDQSRIAAVRDAITPEEIESFRKARNLCNRKVILQVVRMTGIKRTDVLLSAFAQLRRQRCDVELVLIGGGPLEDKMKRLAQDLGILDGVRFLGPLYDERQLALWYSLADVFAMATCIGLSIHHAMCYGVPVVTDDDPRTQTAEFEVLQDGVNGLTYRSGDLGDFCRKLCSILDHPDLAGAMSAAGKRRVEEVYNIQRMVERFHAGIEPLFDPCRTSPAPSTSGLELHRALRRQRDLLHQ